MAFRDLPYLARRAVGLLQSLKRLPPPTSIFFFRRSIPNSPTAISTVNQDAENPNRRSKSSYRHPEPHLPRIVKIETIPATSCQSTVILASRTQRIDCFPRPWQPSKTRTAPAPSLAQPFRRTAPAADISDAFLDANTYFVAAYSCQRLASPINQPPLRSLNDLALPRFACAR